MSPGAGDLGWRDVEAGDSSIGSRLAAGRIWPNGDRKSS